MSGPHLIAVDWGTTRLRAWLVDETGAILEGTSADEGIMAVPAGGFAAVLRRHVGGWLDRHPRLPVMMAGMVGSRNGWAEAPYLACPAGPADLSGAILELDLGDGAKASIVPGLTCRDSAGLPDVMRGEETKLAGCGVSDGLVVMPGTHAKWAWLARGRVERFTTYMTGDVFGALREHTILGKLAEAPADEAGFARGLAAARAGGFITHKAFAARTLVLMGEMPGAQVEPFLSGLLIGEEVSAGLAGAPDASEVTLIADGVFARTYAAAFAEQGVRTRVLAPDDVFVHGLLSIAAARNP